MNDLRFASLVVICVALFLMAFIGGILYQTEQQEKRDHIYEMKKLELLEAGIAIPK